MKNDTYSQLVNVFRDEGSKKNPPTFSLGEVTSTEPLTVKVGDLPLSSDNLLINESLLDHTRGITLPLVTAEGSTTKDTMVDIGIPKAELKIKSKLKKGDIVYIIPTLDKQTWVILCKVVRL